MRGLSYVTVSVTLKIKVFLNGKLYDKSAQRKTRHVVESTKSRSQDYPSFLKSRQDLGPRSRITPVISCQSETWALDHDIHYMVFPFFSFHHGQTSQHMSKPRSSRKQRN